jgi:hypothetical protein
VTSAARRAACDGGMKRPARAKFHRADFGQAGILSRDMVCHKRNWVSP